MKNLLLVLVIIVPICLTNTNTSDEETDDSNNVITKLKTSHKRPKPQLSPIILGNSI